MERLWSWLIDTLMVVFGVLLVLSMAAEAARFLLGLG